MAYLLLEIFLKTPGVISVDEQTHLQLPNEVMLSINEHIPLTYLIKTHLNLVGLTSRC